MIFMLVSTINLQEFKKDFKQALAPLCISQNGGVCVQMYIITKVQKKTLVFHGIDKGRTFWELCSAKCTRLDGCLAEKPSSKTFSAFIFSWLASSVRSLCSLGRPSPLPHKTPRQLSSNRGYGVKVKSHLDNLPFLTFSVNFCLI